MRVGERKQTVRPVPHMIAWFTEPNSATGGTAGKAKELEAQLGGKRGATHHPPPPHGKCEWQNCHPFAWLGTALLFLLNNMLPYIYSTAHGSCAYYNTNILHSISQIIRYNQYSQYKTVDTHAIIKYHISDAECQVKYLQN